MTEPKRPETESPDIEVVAEIDAEPPPKALPLPDPDPDRDVSKVERAMLPEPEPSSSMSMSPSASTSMSAMEGEDDEDEEPGWAALWSYETYEQVARKVLRAGTEVAREGYQRHDAAVVIIAVALIVGGGFVHRFLLEPPMEGFDAHGLHFERTANWLTPEVVPPAAPRLVSDAPPPPRHEEGTLPYHVVFTSDLDPDVSLEVLIDKRPAWSNILTGLELERRNRYGELYASDGGRTRAIAGHDWLRTSYRYAFSPSKGDEPRIGEAVEYATVDREQLYAVTFHGRPAAIAVLEDLIAPTLRVQSRTGMPLIPQNRVTQLHAPDRVLAAMPATVMIVVADVIDGQLRAVGGGSGVVVSGDGSIVTNYHVIHDKASRLHDVFVIARQVGDRTSPQLVCAGKPSRSKYDVAHDLALIKCDRDLDGREWNARNGAWVPLGTTPRREVGLGERLWVLGYPDVGGGGITLSQGLVDGWTGEEDSLAKDFIKTDASITHGNSGGPVVDDEGRVVGIATAFRIRVTDTGGTIETAKIGLIRPWAMLAQAIADARTGWTPREGESSMEIEPDAVEVAPEGALISTKVVDAANDRPVPSALLMVMRSGIRSSDVDLNRLNDQVVAWGRANAEGEVYLRQPVPIPGTYTVVVVAPGYEPLASDGALQLGEDAPPYFDPWGVVKIQASP
jgi:S1-C subfamily serine protease